MGKLHKEAGKAGKIMNGLRFFEESVNLHQRLLIFGRNWDIMQNVEICIRLGSPVGRP